MRPPVESPEVAALEEILQSRDLAIAIQGPAGAGKTTFAAAAVRAMARRRDRNPRTGGGRIL